MEEDPVIVSFLFLMQNAYSKQLKISKGLSLVPGFRLCPGGIIASGLWQGPSWQEVWWKKRLLSAGQEAKRWEMASVLPYCDSLPSGYTDGISTTNCATRRWPHFLNSLLEGRYDSNQQPKLMIAEITDDENNPREWFLKTSLHSEELCPRP